MSDNTYIIVSAIVVIVIVILIKIIHRLNSLFLFHPTKSTERSLKLLTEPLGESIELYDIKTSDGEILSSALINTEEKPSFDHDIILYAHGNAGWIGNLIGSDVVNRLSKFGSVMLFDYRGYGCSTGTPDETGMYKDIRAVWNFLKKKGVASDRITVYGHSLGSSISSHFVRSQVKKGDPPKRLILVAGFSHIKDIAKEIYPILSTFVMVDFNNDDNVSAIDGTVPIYILHSRRDEVIGFHHSKQIKKRGKRGKRDERDKGMCILLEIEGDHNNPIFNDVLDRIFDVSKEDV